MLFACRLGKAKIGHLSGGEKRRVALCRLLLSRPDMLLLDEPTNHLDAESVEWLEQFLHRFPGTVVAVTHDRYFLDNAAEWILELDRGEGIPSEKATIPRGLTRRKSVWSRKNPVLEALLAWANALKPQTAPKSALGKALHYLLEQWPYLVRYLEDGRLELSNNRAERA